MPIIRNASGEKIVLNARELHSAKWVSKNLWEKHGPVSPTLSNALGYEVAITTLTGISKKISDQSFYEIPFADYLPVVVGQNPFTTNITTYRSFSVGDQFESGIINTGGDNSRLAAVDAAVDALNIKVFPWAKSLGYTIFDLEFAARSGNWDLVSQKEQARKTNWDLGLQRVAFLGARGSNASGGSCLGLLNQTGVTANTTLITKPISSMTTAELKTLTAGLVEAYRANNQRTKFPSAFVIPESDYNGLASQASPDFPIKSTLELLEESFKVICRNPKFKILPLAYGDIAYSGLTVQKYVLLNYDEQSLKMEVPLQYQTTLANSLDNFGFQNAGMGQFTGVLLLKPLELLYCQYTPA